MLLQPTHYMLEHPMYQEEKEETKVEEEAQDSIGILFSMKLMNYYDIVH